jgi:hypothetical protein
MAKAAKKVRVASNPQRKKSAKNSRPRKATRKGSHTHMTKNGKKRKASNPRRRKANTQVHHRRRRAHNPSFLGSGKDIMVSAVAGLASAIATSQLPQLILSSNNTGWMGYLANIGTAIAATVLANSVAGPSAGKAAMVGGAVIVLDRFLTENVSAIGPYITLSGVGDATAARMGTIRDGYYLHPTMVDGSGNMIVPQPVTDAAVAAVLAQYPSIAAPLASAMQQNGKKTAGMGAVNPSALRRHTASGQLLSSRFQGRFNTANN